MRLFGLTGFPLSHSFSKAYFEAKFEREKITGCRFENFPLSSISLLPDLIKQESELEGLAVTIPYKKDILPFLDDASQIPPALNACNCIRISSGKLSGFNTDYIGFEKSLLPILLPHHKQALILGNGGATEAVAFVLRKAGIEYQVVSRKLQPGSTLIYEDLHDDLIRQYTIIINTTPVGMYPHTDNCPSIPYHALGPHHLLYDLVYNPAKTVFLQKGEERGAAIMNGERMLMLQAEENWRIWNA